MINTLYFFPNQTHLPGYIERSDALKSEGVDEIVCVSVNDPFVLSAWGKEHKASKDKMKKIDLNTMNNL